MQDDNHDSQGGHGWVVKLVGRENGIFGRQVRWRIFRFFQLFSFFCFCR